MKLIFFVILTIVNLSCSKAHKKLVIDNDAGGDDAMAIFLALLNEKHLNGTKVIALTTTHGNAEEEKVHLNNQRILSIAKRQDVPIYRGATRSLVTTPAVSYYYGVDGLGDSNMTYDQLVPAKPSHAVLTLIELSKKHEGDLIVVTLGPVTNIAQAINLDPQFLDRVDQLYIAAGHIHDDRFTKAEFNAKTDAEAYHVVVTNANPSKVTVFPFSQTHIHLNITKDWRRNVLGAIDSEVIRAQNLYEVVSMKRPGGLWTALDPAMVALALRPDLVKETRYYKNDIHMCGDERGMNRNEEVKIEKANVRVIHSVHKESYMKFLIDLFSKS